MAGKTAAVIGGGPAGLMAAEVLAAGGLAVTVHDRMPSLARRLLMAGRSGLNLTHSEPEAALLARYGAAAPVVAPAIAAFGQQALRDWCAALGQETFIGSSGRVFPKAMKASPLLRAWLGRLAQAGVAFAPRSEWTGWTEDGALRFRDATALPDVTILALGGASWPRLGSDGGWTECLAARGVAVTPLAPANMGISLSWTDIFRDRFAGQPLKNISLGFAGKAVRGDAMVSAYGLEGGPVYSLSAAIRDAGAPATLRIDLRPDMTRDALAERLRQVRARESQSNALRKAAGLAPVAVGLLREAAGPALPKDADALAGLIKSVPLPVSGVQGLERAISSAGGIDLAEIDARFMLRRLPGIFAAGEMLDWEAPTGGYLLQASLATGRAAGVGALDWLASQAEASCPGP